MKHIPPSLSNLKITELLVKLCAKMQLHSISSNIKPRLYFFSLSLQKDTLSFLFLFAQVTKSSQKEMNSYLRLLPLHQIFDLRDLKVTLTERTC